MTKPDLTVVEALEYYAKAETIYAMKGVNQLAETAIPIARRHAEAEAALIETKAALKWLHAKLKSHEVRGKSVAWWISQQEDCPPIIKQMLGEGK